MNTLEEDFNQFMSCRLMCAEAKKCTQVNGFADSLRKTLNPEQTDLFVRVLDFEINAVSILEECAYRQGLSDGLNFHFVLIVKK